MRTGLLVDGSLRPRLRLPTGWTGPRTLASAYYSHNSYQRHYEMVTLWAATSVMHNLCPKKTTTTKKTITHATPPTHTHTAQTPRMMILFLTVYYKFISGIPTASIFLPRAICLYFWCCSRLDPSFSSHTVYLPTLHRFPKAAQLSTAPLSLPSMMWADWAWIFFFFRVCAVPQPLGISITGNKR